MEKDKEKRKDEIFRIWKILYRAAGVTLDEASDKKLREIISDHVDNVVRPGTQLNLFEI